MLVNAISEKRLSHIVEIIAREYPRVAMKAFGHDGHKFCVLASLVACDVLRAAGYPDARVESCGLIASNRAYRQMAKTTYETEAERLVLEIEADRVGAWSVQIPPATSGLTWAGHLVVMVNQYLLDLTLAQASRPNKGLCLAGAVAVPKNETCSNWATMERSDGEIIVVWPKGQETDGYLQVPDANPQRRSKLVSRIIRSIDRDLNNKQPAMDIKMSEPPNQENAVAKATVTTDALNRLIPCPFCGAGTNEIRENGRIWTGMKHSTASSISVLHWCTPVEGQPSRAIERIGKDMESAITAWNMRMNETEQSRMAVSLSDRVIELEIQHGSLRDVAKAMKCNVSYLSRLKEGQEHSPGDNMLLKMGLKRVVTYKRIQSKGEA